MANLTSQNLPFSHCNYQLQDWSLCTPTTCCWDQAELAYFPTLAGNSAYLAIFAVLLIIHVVQGWMYKTWGFAFGIFAGCLLEVIGYAGRIMLNKNVFSNNAFIIYIVCLTIAPAFITAAFYLCLSRIVITYGTHFSRFKPRTYTVVFITSDVIALVLQAIGGAIASTATTHSSVQAGIDIMIAGLAWQVVSLAVFMLLCADYAWRVRRSPEPCNPAFEHVRNSRRFQYFLGALTLATVLVFIRCCYRVAELQQGFNGSLAKNQTTFMVLEGPMMFFAVILVTLFHPGLCFGAAWHTAQWSLRGRKLTEKTTSSDSSFYEETLQKGRTQVNAFTA